MTLPYLDWIAAELEKMKRLKHIFVFLHHPFWWGERYPASNWNEVHRLLVELAQRGTAVLVISSDLPEVLALGERVMVMAHGRIAGELDRAAATEERVMQLAAGTARGPS